MSVSLKEVQPTSSNNQFLSHIQIPKTNCIKSNFNIQTYIGKVNIGGAVAVGAIVTLSILLTPFILFALIPLFWGMLILLREREPDFEQSIQNPEFFKEVLRDLRNLSFHQIIQKYDIDQLYTHGVLDEKTKDTMKDFLYRGNALVARYKHALQDVRLKQEILSKKVQSFATEILHKGAPDTVTKIQKETELEQSSLLQAQLHAKKIMGEAVSLEDDFNAFRNAPNS